MEKNRISSKERAGAVIDYFMEHMPEPETELNHDSPYELIVSVILSAQLFLKNFQVRRQWPVQARRKFSN